MWERQVIAERFQVQRLAGSGGMGSVYRALDQHTGTPVALKVLRRGRSASEDSGSETGTVTLTARGIGEPGGLKVRQAGEDREVARLEREARLLSRLRHPRVVRYIATGATPAGEPYLVMEWLDGETLTDRLKRGALNVEETLTLGVRAAEALGAVHRLGVVHRDVKPSNLFLRGGTLEGLTLIDFGIARRQSASPTLTSPGAVVGTLGYLSPEQAQGDPAVDARSDVFSLGCVLYRCLAGRAPFLEGSPLSVLLQVVSEPPPRLRTLRPEVPPALESLIERMLAKPRDKRPRHGNEVATMLRALERQRLSSASGKGAGGYPWRHLSEAERRFVGLVLARPRSEGTALAAQARTVRDVAERHRGHLEVLDDGSLMVVMVDGSAATDLAAQAARCALSLRPLLGGTVAVVAGRAELDKGLPSGALRERAMDLLAAGEREDGIEHAQVDEVSAVVRVDEVTAGLLRARFELETVEGGAVLRGERPAGRATRSTGKLVACVGRERELAQLETLFLHARDEARACAALVTAAPGTGKSWLLHEFLVRLRGRGEAMEIWVGQGNPTRAGGAFGLLGHALRSAVGLRGGESIAERRREARAWVGRHLDPSGPLCPDELVASLGELFALPPRTRGEDGNGTVFRDPAMLRTQMRRAWIHLVRTACAGRPLLLVLEDLHWGDLPSIRLVDAILDELHDLPLMVLALARPEVEEVFPKLWEKRRLQHIRLDPLTRRASERLARMTLGDRASDRTIAALVERADGNAFYLDELLRAATRGAGRALPESVLAMMHTHLERLDSGARRLLRAASLFGQTFWRGGVEALTDGEDAAAGLAELAAKELVTPQQEGRFPGEVEYRFRDTLVREAAYGMLSDEDRALGHRLAAEWLEQAGRPRVRSGRSSANLLDG
ncbi:serine/threonine-protein kinase PknK [Chondromyces crocatus]|uniref:Protein kinase n=1 Tax=Chondromyces crocatus TaxID=52 RepID=A0A0K1EP55_CHOCO|nr:serine/threonine-protein kinase [Chondromyces crocatus]AKT42695.1 protein kinase [Chondromyces crocatus]